MKGVIKAVIAGSIIIAIGIAIVIATLAFNGWSFKKPDFVMNNFTATEDNTALNIDIGAGSVKTEYYDGDKISIDYPSSSIYEVKTYEKDGVLTFKCELKRHIFNWSFDIPETLIRLPQNMKYDIDLDMAAGTVNLAGGVFGKINLHMSAGTLNAGELTCETLECKMSAGTVKISKATCNSLECKMSAGTTKIDSVDCGQSRIKLSAGTAKMGFVGAQAEYKISTKVSAGSCNVGNQDGNTGKSIDVSISAGTVKLDFDR